MITEQDYKIIYAYDREETADARQAILDQFKDDVCLWYIVCLVILQFKFGQLKFRQFKFLTKYLKDLITKSNINLKKVKNTYEDLINIYKLLFLFCKILNIFKNY